MENPLIPELFAVLMSAFQAGRKPLKIYEVFEAVAEHALFSHFNNSSDSLELFHKNFWIMNGLYQLQLSVWEDHQLYLFISTLEIQLLSVSDSEVGLKGLQESDTVRRYYLNWENANDMTEQGVQVLLDGFWRCYYQTDEHHLARHRDALAVLGVSDGANDMEIRIQYRKLASEHHPDKGGTADQFVAIRAAYEFLIH